MHRSITIGWFDYFVFQYGVWYGFDNRLTNFHYFKSKKERNKIEFSTWHVNQMEWKYVERNLLLWKVFLVEQFPHSEWNYVIVIKIIGIRKKLKKKSFFFSNMLLCHVDSIHIDIVYSFITKKMHNNKNESFSFAYFRWYRKCYVENIFFHYSMQLKTLLKLKLDRFRFLIGV